MLFQQAGLNPFNQVQHHEEGEHLGGFEPDTREFKMAVVVDDPSAFAAVPHDGTLEPISEEVDVTSDRLFGDALKLLTEQSHRHDALFAN